MQYISVWQGQEAIAMDALERARREGGWVLLQNIHLTIDWTAGPLEKRVDKLAEGAHADFRCLSIYNTAVHVGIHPVCDLPVMLHTAC